MTHVFENIGSVTVTELLPKGGLAGLEVSGVFLVRSPGPVINQALAIMNDRGLRLLDDHELASQIRRRLGIDSSDSRVIFAVEETANAVAA